MSVIAAMWSQSMPWRMPSASAAAKTPAPPPMPATSMLASTSDPSQARTEACCASMELQLVATSLAGAKLAAPPRLVNGPPIAFLPPACRLAPENSCLLARWRSPPALERLGLLALVLVYLATVLPNLGDDPIVGGDEGWIISSAARLAEDGVFGSDLFRGLYGAENQYYFNLPLHHLVLAAVFKLSGVGVLQARLVSVVFGLAALLLTFALCRGPP